MLDGVLGWENVGKVICVYPSDENRAEDIARKLIDISEKYDGPLVPSAAHLGGRVYCRFGAHKGIMRFTMRNGYLPGPSYQGAWWAFEARLFTSSIQFAFLGPLAIQLHFRTGW